MAKGKNSRKEKKKPKKDKKVKTYQIPQKEGNEATKTAVLSFFYIYVNGAI